MFSFEQERSHTKDNPSIKVKHDLLNTMFHVYCIHSMSQPIHIEGAAVKLLYSYIQYVLKADAHLRLLLCLVMTNLTFRSLLCLAAAAIFCTEKNIQRMENRRPLSRINNSTLQVITKC